MFYFFRCSEEGIAPLQGLSLVNSILLCKQMVSDADLKKEKDILKHFLAQEISDGCIADVQEKNTR